MKFRKITLLEATSLVLLILTGIFLIALQLKPWGWLIWLAGISTLIFCTKKFRKDILLIFLSLGILGVTPITTDTSYGHMLLMGTTLTLAIILPYYVSRYVYKDYLVKFKFHHGRKWFKTEILYIITAFLAYIILPFYFRDTAAHLNWTVEPGISNIVRLFIGTNALGIWDELFFISTVLGILRRYLSFDLANILQSILFTSFLYELGFTGWGFVMIFIFAIVQGLIFKKTESLFYVITIHLTLDLILFLALIHAHHPSWMPIFIT